MEDRRVAIVSDQLLTRAGLASLLRPFCRLVGQTSYSPDVVRDLEVYRPDVILADLDWPLDRRSALINSMATLGLPMVGLLESDEEVGAAVGMLAAFPVYGLLPRETPPERLAQALEAVYSGFLLLDPAYRTAIAIERTTPTPPPTDPLTPREQEVLRLLATGETNKAIARRLGITDHTVKFHLNAIMTKLGAQSRTDAVARAVRSGVLTL
jgi:two-component system, NarL family, nitrate/nitrite response regulator NarL